MRVGTGRHSHGFSMEEEAQRILKEAVSTPDRLADLALELLSPRHGVDLQLPEHAPQAPTGLRE